MDDVIKELMKDLQLDYKDNTWEVKHGGKSITCVKHKALEKIAAHKQIRFDPPAMIANDPDKRVAAMCVTGHLGDRAEWAIGEAAPSNNKNNYPYAMAEKRAKDRVILKLLNVAGDYYAQDEADQFEEAKPNNVEPRKKDPEPEPQPDPEPAAEKEPDVKEQIQEWATKVNEDIEKPFGAEAMFVDQWNRLMEELDKCKQQSHLNAWKEGNRQWLDRFKKDKPKEYKEILGWYNVKKGQISTGKLSSIREDIPI
tara:strand:- start:3522 stop:4283 length:762 start_codon:yes stop_codon:yes gene_type:complete